MKKILLTLALTLSAINVVAQEHLSFMGIPIEGSMSEFCEKIEEKGFTPVGNTDNFFKFTGRFTGQDVEICIPGSGDGKNVLAVTVWFGISEEWNSLVTYYDYYKDLYTSKYGEPDRSKEHNPALSDTNTALMYALRQGQVDYESTWYVTGGIINLGIHKSLDSENIFGGRIIIMYMNIQSRDMQTQQYLDDI